ncbi:hypothetical protein C5167_005383 [Papaver somniferum]|uniref:Serine hydroxymethyltransferase-like domain-containing protein n=1 Tax=Papaver somniferum TaxID=3469 RepID=A0A4Y7JEL1_PAPSO|nr:hypothetical protein C5167_005383 [Papaver somniferum]
MYGIEANAFDGSANTPEYKNCQKQILKNARRLAKALEDLGYGIVTGGTDNHLVVVNIGTKGIDAQTVLKVMEAVCISAGRHTRPDTITMGSLALTSRGFIEEHFAMVADFIDQAVSLALKIRNSCGSVVDDALMTILLKKNKEVEKQIQALKGTILQYASKFPQVGNNEQKE